jgi:hypothetical protein
MPKNNFLAPVPGCLVGLISTAAIAHHSFAEYEQTRTIELQGKLVNVAWQNPHVHFTTSSGRSGCGGLENR